MKKPVGKNKMFRKLWMLIPAVLLMVWCLAGCAGSGEETPGGGETRTEEHSDAVDASGETGGKATEETDETGEKETAGEKEESKPLVTGMHKALEARYDAAQPYSEGYAVVGQDNNGVMKYNYIDLEGNYLLDEWVDAAYPFSDGMACVGYETQPDEDAYMGDRCYLYGYIDTTGQLVIPAEYLGTETDHPLCFYNGYAEVQYYVLQQQEYYSNYSLYYNVIDKQNHPLYDFDVSPSDNWGYGSGPDYRILTLNWDLSPWRNLYFYSPWMVSLVEGKAPEEMILTDGVRSYLIGADNSVISSTDGNAEKVNDRYYCVRMTDQETGQYQDYITDEKFNIIQEGYYYVYPGWEELPYLIKETPVSGEFYHYADYQVCDMELQPLTGVFSRFAPISKDHKIIVKSETDGWQLLDADLQVISNLEGDFDWMTSLEKYDGQQYWLEGVRNTENGDGVVTSTTVTLLDKNGKFLREATGTTGAFTVLSDELLLMVSEGKQPTLIDAEGKDVKELPYSAIYYAGEGSEDNTYILYTYGENNVSLYFELVKTSSGWELQELGDSFSIDGYYSGYEDGVLAENEESRILGTYAWSTSGSTDPVSLEDAEGNVLDEQAALSLVEDGLYLVGTRFEYNENNWTDEAHDMYLQNVEKSMEGTVYDKLGQLSEGRMAFLENGKWGYLELEYDAGRS